MKGNLPPLIPVVGLIYFILNDIISGGITEIRVRKMRKLEKYASVIDTLNEWIGNIMKFSILAIGGMLIIEVTARYGFNSPTFWAHESSALLLGAYMFLAGGYCLLHGSHVKIEIFWRLLSRKQQAILDLCTSWIFFVFVFFLGWQVVRRAWISVMWLEGTQSSWSPPVWPLKIIAAVGIFLLFIQGTVKFVRDFYRAKGIEL